MDEVVSLAQISTRLHVGWNDLLKCVVNPFLAGMSIVIVYPLSSRNLKGAYSISISFDFFNADSVLERPSGNAGVLLQNAIHFNVASMNLLSETCP